MNIRINNKDEDRFFIGLYEFTRLPKCNGMIPMVSTRYITDRVFGDNANLAESDVLQYLERYMLPVIEESVGAENLAEFETDLTNYNGDDSYGFVKSKISLPTFQFYLDNRAALDKGCDYFWWTATPFNTNGGVVCVSPYEREYSKNCGYFNGIRPMIMLKESAINL